MLVMMLGLGYTVGSQSLMSRANGAGRAEEVGAIFRQSAIFMTACGFVIMLASWFLIGPMFERFIAADAVRKAADDYVFWRLAGLPFAYVGLLARAYFRCRDAHPGDYVGIYCDGARQLRLKFAAYLWSGAFPRMASPAQRSPLQSVNWRHWQCIFWNSCGTAPLRSSWR